jgi:hypothetical protein
MPVPAPLILRYFSVLICIGRKLDAQDAKARIEKARNKRLLHSKLSGQTLGDVADEGGEEALVSASDWVQRSRKKAVEMTAKEKAAAALALAAKRMQDDEEGEGVGGSQQQYGAADLKGVEVMHGENTFQLGESVILTLADSNILDTDERGNVLGVNMDNDVLENVNMTEEEKRQDREKTKKRSRQPVYAGYDDAEFEEGSVPRSRPALLSQYDQEEKRGPQMRLGEGGLALSTAAGSKEGAGAGAGAGGHKAVAQSLQVQPTHKALSEYLTPAEYASFSKPKKDKAKKKRKIRKKDSSGLIEELEAALEVEVASSVVTTAVRLFFSA